MGRTETEEQQRARLILERIGYKGRQLKRRAFLVAFAETGNVSLAAEAAGCSRKTHYQWKKEDQDYAHAAEEAAEMAADLLEASALHRAKDGVTEPVLYQGVPVLDANGNPLVTVRYSDTLTIFLLKALRPAKYRERYDITGGVGPKGEALPIEVALTAKEGLRRRLGLSAERLSEDEIDEQEGATSTEKPPERNPEPERFR